MNEMPTKVKFHNRHPLIVLTGGVLALALIYFLVRSPVGRYSDYIWLATRWAGLWILVSDIPRQFEPGLNRLGLLPSGLLETQLRDGTRILLDPKDLVDRTVLASGVWEPIEWGWIEKSLAPGDVFIDVGAHHGTYTLRAARVVVDSGLVVAVEPNPASVERLKKNVTLNGLRNVRVIEAACGDQSTSRMLFVASDRNTGMASFSLRTSERSGPAGGSASIEVNVERLDDLVGTLSGRRIAAIKVDTEGAETMVLRGAVNTIREHSPVIVVEEIESQLTALGSSVQELEALLTSYGYSKHKSTRDNALWVHSRQ